MFTLSFVVKNKKYRLTIDRGQDILFALDNFLKSNKLDFTCLKNVKTYCLDSRDSISCRIGKIIVFVLNKTSKV